MVDEVLVQCLENYRRVVLPGFGAFIRKEEGGDVVFVDLLRRDDSVLVSQLMTAYHTTEVSAKAMAEDYVAGIRDGVMRDGSFIIAGLGILTATPDGRYRFEYRPDGSGASADQVAGGNDNPASSDRFVDSQSARADAVNETMDATVGSMHETPVSAPGAAAKDAWKGVVSAERADKDAGLPCGVSTEVSTFVPDSVHAEASTPTPDNKGKASGPAHGYPHEPLSIEREDVKNLRYQKPAKPVMVLERKTEKKRADKIMIMAIIAAAIAICAMIYGIFTTTVPEIDLRGGERTEQTYEE